MATQVQQAATALQRQHSSITVIWHQRQAKRTEFRHDQPEDAGGDLLLGRMRCLRCQVRNKGRRNWDGGFCGAVLRSRYAALMQDCGSTGPPSAL